MGIYQFNSRFVDPNGYPFGYADGKKPPMLDLYPNAFAAYSVRKLRKDYTGPCLKVRRSSDNDELDIGFVGDGLDIAGLETFCSGTNGFVKTWYDQSENDIDAVQDTSASQPQIVSAGAVLTENTKPKLSFNGTSSFLTTSGYILELSQNSVAVFVTCAPIVSNYCLVEADAVSPYSSNFLLGGGGGEMNEIVWVNNSLIGIQPSTSQMLLSLTKVDSVVATYGNGVFSEQATPTINTEVGSTTGIGGHPLYTIYYRGSIQEIITYKTNKSEDIPRMNASINKYFEIY